MPISGLPKFKRIVDVLLKLRHRFRFHAYGAYGGSRYGAFCFQAFKISCLPPSIIAGAVSILTFLN
jgi:hypothetical protein